MSLAVGGLGRDEEGAELIRENGSGREPKGIRAAEPEKVPKRKNFIILGNGVLNRVEVRDGWFGTACKNLRVIFFFRLV